MVMAPEVGIAVIGCGGISGTHLRTLASLPDVQVRVVCDIDAGRAKQRAEEFSVPRWTTDYREALADDSVHAVFVLVPQGHHAEIVIAAAQAGKHIFCEKPMAMSITECRAMNEAVKKSGVILQIGYVMRFSEDAQKVKEWLNRIGRPAVFRDMWAVVRGSPARWVHDAKMGGGTLWENSHWLDFMNWLFGRPTRVYAKLRRFKPEDTTAWDTTILVVDYAGGDLAVWGEAWTAPGFGWNYIRYRSVRPHLDIIGPHGSIHFPAPDGSKMAALFLNGAGDEPVETHEWQSDWGATGNGYRREVEHFIECVREGKEPLCTGEDGEWAIQIAEGAVRSHETGMPVSLPLP
jgi:predicted dehydrogenase